MGGGPAGLYFALLMKKADPGHDVTVVERNRADDTFGFGVVFSDATLDTFIEADRPTGEAITRAFAHWDDIDIHYQGQVLASTGHGFSGMSRQALLDILQRRCAELGVALRFQTDVTDLTPYRDADLVLAADGVNSLVRSEYAEHFQPHVDWRPNRFVWLGTTFPFRAFTFIFKESPHGLWRVHAYRYDARHSTFIVETTETTWRRAGLDQVSEDDTVVFAERLFARELEGHRLLKNRSLWRSFPTVKNAHWHWNNVVLIGDAAHTAHFSIGSGTKLAMEDAIALAAALHRHRDVAGALDAYEEERRPQVESIQRAAQVSLEWFEQTERYHGRLEPLQFAFSLLTRSLRVTHDNLKVRDAKFVETVDRWFAAKAADQSKVSVAAQPVPPPMFIPLRLRELVLANRVVVSPMCQYSADDGTPNDWHLVNLGSRAVGGAGLVIAEMTDVSREGRISPGCTGMYKPEHVTAWKRVVDFVHAHSPARIALQLAHAGRKGSTRRLWEGIDEPLAEGNWPLISASAIPYFPHSQIPKAMDRADMERVQADFVKAASMAEAAGFDMLELHMAHGYLLASFVSPLTNTRTDAYGGTLDNRLCYPLAVFDAVRAVWPAARPISVKISATDWADGGVTPEESVEFARRLKAHGCDLVTVSTGQTVAHQHPAYGRLYQTPFSDRIRHEAGIATMTVGAVASYADVNSILAAGRADLCALARGHLYDPYWTRHAAWEQGFEVAWPDQYVSVKGFTPRLR
ncbi:MAG: oxidoreductase [Candidatus Rokubacteria bacterium 13_1_20CM_2_68_19]|nr:MAG: oxidoreductase [Candidatus Rokubacteria bacterium 13_1_40CM_4_67_11]OLD31708.1 MAG: oxidoreductase [Candidatus Rokubacteria bacterium 13_1_40CM_2_68_13]OLE45552.1 MAG: oxidoreductase [Candidatus Rokubacteria bacterium 13_1_20CM_2_68_19]